MLIDILIANCIDISEMNIHSDFVLSFAVHETPTGEFIYCHVSDGLEVGLNLALTQGRK